MYSPLHSRLRDSATPPLMPHYEFEGPSPHLATTHGRPPPHEFGPTGSAGPPLDGQVATSNAGANRDYESRGQGMHGWLGSAPVVSGVRLCLPGRGIFANQELL
jgi:hypothetical protein